MSATTATHGTTVGTTTGTTSSTVAAADISKARAITSYAITTVVGLFLAVDAISHLLNVQTAQDWNEKYGAPDWFNYPLGIALAVSLVVHLTPRTAVLGAVLINAYLGGAIAVNLFINDQAVFGAAFAFVVATLVWVGLWLRDDRVKVLYTR